MTANEGLQHSTMRGGEGAMQGVRGMSRRTLSAGGHMARDGFLQHPVSPEEKHTAYMYWTFTFHNYSIHGSPGVL